MKTVDIGEFEQHPGELLSELEPFGLLITKDGEPFLRVVRADANPQVLLYGRMKGRLEVLGDIYSTGEWVDE